MLREDPGAYLPIDRLHTMARGEDLPVVTAGAALFADVAGFTPLTEAMARALGPRLGAEELTRHLNLVYEALITEAHRYGGSVITFSGDAITCWFDGDDGRRATACALEMQGALARVCAVALPSGGKVVLAMKIAVAAGPVRRFVVGDPSLRLIDVLAGATLGRMAAAEALAHRAEVILSPECAPALGDDALILEWRAPSGAGPGARYPVVGGLMQPVPPRPWPALPTDDLPLELLRPWLLPPLYAEIAAGQAAIQPELRPATALFARFATLDYDDDPEARQRLDAYIRWAQAIVDRYEGNILQLSIGDKGSYYYAIFGAPLAPERSAVRAALAALELRAPPAELACMGPTQIGLSEGTVWAGAYGGAACRTYGVLGDEVNLAARLMQRAAPGEILASERVQRAVAGAVQAEALAPVDLKGKSRPVPVARLLAAWPAAPAPAPAGPLVGRAAELAWLRERVAPALAGRFAGVAAVYGEPGIGKSRLVEALREELAGPGAASPVTWLACAGEQPARPALDPFGQLIRRHLGLAPELPAEARAAHLDARLDALAADLDARGAAELRARLDAGRPFLAALCGLPPAAKRYDQTAPEERLGATIGAAVALIRAESARHAVVLHVEDAGWLDAASLALVETLAREGAGHALALLVSSRYGDDGRPPLGLDPAIPLATLELAGLDQAAVEELASAALGEAVAAPAAAFLAAKTSGNPLFVEQLALDLRERGALAGDPGRRGPAPAVALAPFLAPGRPQADEVPASITAVLVARIDRLPREARAATQLAAVLGQEFDLQALALMAGDDPLLAAGVSQALAHGIWAPAGAARYRFRHALLRDAAYQMQLQARLRELHGQAARALELVAGASLAPYVADLARHARLAGDAPREQRYSALLGEQAFNLSAFDEAVSWYERALALAADGPPAARGPLLARLARAHALAGRDDTARRRYEESLAAAEAGGEAGAAAEACFELGALALRRGEHEGGRARLERALALFDAAGDAAGQARALNRLGALHIELGEAEAAVAYYQRALELGRQGRRR